MSWELIPEPKQVMKMLKAAVQPTTLDPMNHGNYKNVKDALQRGEQVVNSINHPELMPVSQSGVIEPAKDKDGKPIETGENPPQSRYFRFNPETAHVLSCLQVIGSALPIIAAQGNEEVPRRYKRQLDSHRAAMQIIMKAMQVFKPEDRAGHMQEFLTSQLIKEGSMDLEMYVKTCMENGDPLAPDQSRT
ncbi:hypothetical protein LZ31DRAFT_573992 [Colletotrichum somersetense]|nr:hypothetical protein LZ31DRAFT_573992 [Colletotrichum somersetense]